MGSVALDRLPYPGVRPLVGIRSRGLLIECPPGIPTTRLPRGVAPGRPHPQALVGALRSSTREGPENAEPPLARAGHAMNRCVPRPLGYLVIPGPPLTRLGVAMVQPVLEAPY